MSFQIKRLDPYLNVIEYINLVYECPGQEISEVISFTVRTDTIVSLEAPNFIGYTHGHSRTNFTRLCAGGGAKFK